MLHKQDVYLSLEYDWWEVSLGITPSVHFMSGPWIEVILVIREMLVFWLWTVSAGISRLGTSWREAVNFLVLGSGLFFLIIILFFSPLLLWRSRVGHSGRNRRTIRHIDSLVKLSHWTNNIVRNLNRDNKSVYLSPCVFSWARLGHRWQNPELNALSRGLHLDVSAEINSNLELYICINICTLVISILSLIKHVVKDIIRNRGN